MSSPLAVLGLGFALGLRHALDVDHLAAVSTIVIGRRGLVRSALVGAVWGVGHTTSLLAVAVAVIALHAEIPRFVAPFLELGVAAMLVGLGLNVLWTVSRGGRLHAHPHEHGAWGHVHPHLHARATPQHAHGATRCRPFLVGLVHGLAGSAGLMLAVVATIPDPALALLYVTIFGAGSIGGMALMSTVFALPRLVVHHRLDGAERWLRLGAGFASLVVGAQQAWEIGRGAGFMA